MLSSLTWPCLPMGSKRSVGRAEAGLNVGLCGGIWLVAVQCRMCSSRRGARGLSFIAGRVCTRGPGELVSSDCCFSLPSLQMRQPPRSGLVLGSFEHARRHCDAMRCDCVLLFFCRGDFYPLCHERHTIESFQTPACFPVRRLPRVVLYRCASLSAALASVALRKSSRKLRSRAWTFVRTSTATISSVRSGPPLRSTADLPSTLHRSCSRSCSLLQNPPPHRRLTPRRRGPRICMGVLAARRLMRGGEVEERRRRLVGDRISYNRMDCYWRYNAVCVILRAATFFSSRCRNQ